MVLGGDQDFRCADFVRQKLSGFLAGFDMELDRVSDVLHHFLEGVSLGVAALNGWNFSNKPAVWALLD